MRRELNAVLVCDAGEELRRLGTRGRRDEKTNAQNGKSREDCEAKHGPVEGTRTRTADLQVLTAFEHRERSSSPRQTRDMLCAT